MMRARMCLRGSSCVCLCWFAGWLVGCLAGRSVVTYSASTVALIDWLVHTRYVLFLGEQPMLLPQSPEDEAAFAAQYKPKNLVRLVRPSAA